MTDPAGANGCRIESTRPAVRPESASSANAPASGLPRRSGTPCGAGGGSGDGKSQVVDTKYPDPNPMAARISANTEVPGRRFKSPNRGCRSRFPSRFGLHPRVSFHSRFLPHPGLHPQFGFQLRHFSALR